MAKGSAGVILFPEDVARIGRCVKPQYQFAVISALSRYAATGELPTEAELGEGGMVAFEFVRDKIDAALASYDKGRKQRQDAVRKRWDTDACGTVRNDTDAYGSIRPHDSASKTETETETDTETETEADGEVRAIDGADLTEDIQRNRTADALIAAFNLQRDDPTREALIEDLAKHGEKRMREALAEACRSNSRGRVSVNFWRAVLGGKGRSRDAPQYQRRTYSAQDFAGMEVQFDELGQ